MDVAKAANEMFAKMKEVSRRFGKPMMLSIASDKDEHTISFDGTDIEISIYECDGRVLFSVNEWKGHPPYSMRDLIRSFTNMNHCIAEGFACFFRWYIVRVLQEE